MHSADVSLSLMGSKRFGVQAVEIQQNSSSPNKNPWFSHPLGVPLEVLDDRFGQDAGGAGSVNGVLGQHACDSAAKSVAVLVRQRQFLTCKHTCQISLQTHNFSTCR